MPQIHPMWIVHWCIVILKSLLWSQDPVRCHQMEIGVAILSLDEAGLAIKANRPQSIIELYHLVVFWSKYMTVYCSHVSNNSSNHDHPDSTSFRHWIIKWAIYPRMACTFKTNPFWPVCGVILDTVSVWMFVTCGCPHLGFQSKLFLANTLYMYIPYFKQFNILKLSLVLFFNFYLNIFEISSLVNSVTFVS